MIHSSNNTGGPTTHGTSGVTSDNINNSNGSNMSDGANNTNNMRVMKSFPGTHDYYIHDIKYDFYGQRLATCSSDERIKVWDLVDGDWKCSYDWKAHNGSIWKVEWSHPEFGQILASCSFDRTVCIWEEPLPGELSIPDVNPSPHSLSLSSVPTSSLSSNIQYTKSNTSLSSNTSKQQVTAGISGNNVIGNTASSILNAGESGSSGASGHAWVKKASLVDSTDSVVDIKFAPRHMGLKLATCSLDGQIRIYEAVDVMNLAHWPVQYNFEAHKKGVTCISWNPSKFEEPMIAVGCNDGTVKLWQYTEKFRRWQHIISLDSSQKMDIHDIAWAPIMGRTYHLIAAASKSGIIDIWKLTPKDKNSNYSVKLIYQMKDHKSEVWKVEWNLTGTVLASSGDDGTIRLWKLSPVEEDKWICFNVIKGISKK